MKAFHFDYVEGRRMNRIQRESRVIPIMSLRAFRTKNSKQANVGPGECWENHAQPLTLRHSLHSTG